MHHLKSFSISNVEKLKFDLFIFSSRSWSGRLVDSKFIVNAFINESIESMTNSLELFEKGYFDCAFYCLRSSIELSTTILYLHDMDKEKRMESYSNWINNAKIPFRSKMMNELLHHGEYCSDLKLKLESILGKNGLVEITNNDLNKHVHKQGFGEFITIRNNPFSSMKYDDNELVEDFTRLFKNTLKIVATMRLVIDPFPMLLLDPEINSRCPELDEPYDEQFVREYFSEDEIASYKTTKIYKEAYKALIQKESCCEGIIDIKRYWIYDHRRESEIRKQAYLLNSQEQQLAELVFSFPKILRIKHGSGIPLAQTEVPILECDNKEESFQLFQIHRNGGFNVPYKDRYISSFISKDDSTIKCYIDHTEPFDDEEIYTIDEWLCLNSYFND